MGEGYEDFIFEFALIRSVVSKVLLQTRMIHEPHNIFKLSIINIINIMNTFASSGSRSLCSGYNYGPTRLQIKRTYQFYL